MVNKTLFAIGSGVNFGLFVVLLATGFDLPAVIAGLGAAVNGYFAFKS